jgi:hypothetical protein
METKVTSDEENQLLCSYLLIIERYCHTEKGYEIEIYE